MNTLKISTRLMMLVALLAITLPLIAWLGLHGLYSANQRMRAIYDDRLVATAQLGRVTEQLVMNRLAFNSVARDPSPPRGKPRRTAPPA